MLGIVQRMEHPDDGSKKLCGPGYTALEDPMICQAFNSAKDAFAGAVKKRPEFQAEMWAIKKYFEGSA